MAQGDGLDLCWSDPGIGGAICETVDWSAAVKRMAIALGMSSTSTIEEVEARVINTQESAAAAWAEADNANAQAAKVEVEHVPVGEDRSKPPAWAVDEDVPDGEFFDEVFQRWVDYSDPKGLWALHDRITAPYREALDAAREQAAEAERWKNELVDAMLQAAQSADAAGLALLAEQVSESKVGEPVRLVIATNTAEPPESPHMWTDDAHQQAVAAAREEGRREGLREAAAMLDTEADGADEVLPRRVGTYLRIVAERVRAASPKATPEPAPNGWRDVTEAMRGYGFGGIRYAIENARGKQVFVDDDGLVIRSANGVGDDAYTACHWAPEDAVRHVLAMTRTEPPAAPKAAPEPSPGRAVVVLPPGWDGVRAQEAVDLAAWPNGYPHPADVEPPAASPQSEPGKVPGPLPQCDAIVWEREEGMDGGDVWTAEHEGWRLTVQGGLMDDAYPTWEWEAEQDGPPGEVVRGEVSVDADPDGDEWEAVALGVVARAKARAQAVVRALSDMSPTALQGGRDAKPSERLRVNDRVRVTAIGYVEEFGGDDFPDEVLVMLDPEKPGLWLPASDVSRAEATDDLPDPAFSHTDEYGDTLVVRRFPECWSFHVDPAHADDDDKTVAAKVPNDRAAALARVLAAPHGGDAGLREPVRLAAAHADGETLERRRVVAHLRWAYPDAAREVARGLHERTPPAPLADVKPAASPLPEGGPAPHPERFVPGSMASILDMLDAEERLRAAGRLPAVAPKPSPKEAAAVAAYACADSLDAEIDRLNTELRAAKAESIHVEREWARALGVAADDDPLPSRERLAEMTMMFTGNTSAEPVPAYARDAREQIERLADYLNGCDAVADESAPVSDSAIALIEGLSTTVIALGAALSKHTKPAHSPRSEWTAKQREVVDRLRASLPEHQQEVIDHALDLLDKVTIYSAEPAPLPEPDSVDA